MAVSSGQWVPYPTEEQPIRFGTLPEWDSIMINGVTLPIEGVPKYTRELGLDKKKGAGTDYYALTSKGIKPSEIHITLKLWIDQLTKINYLDMYRLLIPQLIAPRLDKRFSIPIYHPALSAFGVTSAVFAKVPTPEHVGGLIFHVQLEAVDGRDAKQSVATKEKAKPDTSALTALGPPHPRTFESNLGINKITIPQVDANGNPTGTSTTTAWQTRINTPSARSTDPNNIPRGTP